MGHDDDFLYSWDSEGQAGTSRGPRVSHLAEKPSAVITGMR